MSTATVVLTIEEYESFHRRLASAFKEIDFYRSKYLYVEAELTGKDMERWTQARKVESEDLANFKRVKRL